MSRVAAGLTVLVALALLACSPGDDGPTDLGVVLRTAGGERDEYKLKCDPPGGTVPNPRGLCDALADHRKTMFARPAEGLCSLGIGSLFADVDGTFRGEKVRATLYFCGGNGKGMLLWIRRGGLPVPPG